MALISKSKSVGCRRHVVTSGSVLKGEVCRVNAKGRRLVEELGFRVLGDVWMTGQDPGKLEVGNAQHATTGVDKRVVVVVRVQDPVVAVRGH